MDHETVEEMKRHFGIVAEGLRSDIRAVAEGQVGLRDEILRFRQEVADEFKETKAMIRLSYAELDRRIRGLELDVTDLRGRLERVEARVLPHA